MLDIGQRAIELMLPVYHHNDENKDDLLSTIYLYNVMKLLIGRSLARNIQHLVIRPGHRMNRDRLPRDLVIPLLGASGRIQSS